MKLPVKVHLALGTNLGDRPDNLSRALAFLQERVTVLNRSSIYETPPWGLVNQPRFLNMVVLGTTLLSPAKLLDFLKGIEARMGRTETVRFGPRIIDLDILLYGRRCITTSRLQVPHPRMLERAFVLVPLVEIEPELVIPGTGQSVQSFMLNRDTTGITLYQQKAD